MITVGDLRDRLKDVPDHVWVCLKDGPAAEIKMELGANEPFVLLLTPMQVQEGIMAMMDRKRRG